MDLSNEDPPLTVDPNPLEEVIGRESNPLLPIILDEDEDELEVGKAPPPKEPEFFCFFYIEMNLNSFWGRVSSNELYANDLATSIPLRSPNWCRGQPLSLLWLVFLQRYL